MHSAVGHQNFSDVVVYGSQILESDAEIEGHEYHYLLGAILASNYVTGDNLASADLLHKYFDLDSYDQSPFYLQYLIGLSVPESDHD